MLTHKIKLPDGTEIEFFATDEAVFQEKFGELNPLQPMQSIAGFKRYQRLQQQFVEQFTATKHKAKKSSKQARKRQKQARRKQR